MFLYSARRQFEFGLSEENELSRLCPFLDNSERRGISKSAAMLISLLYQGNICGQLSSYQSDRVGIYVVADDDRAPYYQALELPVTGRVRNLSKVWGPKTGLKVPAANVGAALARHLLVRGPTWVFTSAQFGLNLVREQANNDFSLSKIDAALVAAATISYSTHGKAVAGTAELFVSREAFPQTIEGHLEITTPL